MSHLGSFGCSLALKECNKDQHIISKYPLNIVILLMEEMSTGVLLPDHCPTRMSTGVNE